MSTHVNYLRNHAKNNVWCAPSQDSQFTFTLPRVSAVAGAFSVVKISDYTIQLPSEDFRYQVFQIGGIPPAALNMLNRELHWVRSDTHANELKSHVRVHNNLGIVASACDVYYHYTEEGNLLVAVRMHAPTGFVWSSDRVFLSLYANAYWQTVEGQSDPVGFEVVSSMLETGQEVNDFNTAYAAAAAKAASPIQLMFWHNGTRKEYSASLINVGDSVFFELDGSIKKRYTFPIAGTQVFDSTLDAARKYLLPPPKDADSTTIDYMDDVDFFVVGKSTAGDQALLYPVLAERDVRQLTHRDYSVMVSNVVYQSEYLRSIGQGIPNTHSIQAVVRKSGFTRELVHEGSFIQALYELDEPDVLRAMHGIDATVDFWRAHKLEESSYPKLMRAKDVCAITYEDVEKAYGYYAMAKALADTPNKVQDPGSTGYVHVPYLCAFGSTAYEYDSDGLFIGWHHHYTGVVYYTRSERCAMVEFIAGIGGGVLDEIHNAASITLKQDRNYRVYLRQIVGGQIQPGFTDVTGSDKYTVQGNVLTWRSQAVTDYPLVRSDKRFFAMDFNARNDESRLVVNLVTSQTHGGTLRTLPISVPLGQVDVFLNGRSLIRGLHYYYKDSQIVITSKEYLNFDSPIQNVHVRVYGFCRPDGSLYPEGDIGFIEHGLLSSNNRFDIRDGRVSRVVINGLLRDPSEFKYAESNEVAAPADTSNGLPYMIKDLFVPLVPFAASDTWELIEKAKADVKKATDYLTLKIPQPDRGPVVGVVKKHAVISPFLSKILFDLLYSRLTLPTKPSFTRQEILEICKSYEVLLETDPIKQLVDKRYVVIDMHASLSPMVVNARQWSFLNQVIKLYADGLVAINDSLLISQ